MSRVAWLLPVIALLAMGNGKQPARPVVPSPPDCTAPVGYDRDQMLPGYLVATAAGPKTCIPFTTVAATPPANYRGDFYVAAFSDARLRAQWAACKTDAACFARVSRQIAARRPPNRERAITDPHARFLLGKVEEPAAGLLDLTRVRRPAFFAAAPYREPIAALDSRATTVEFTAPADAFERLHRNEQAPVRLRGWYLRGAGVGPSHRPALVVMTGGGGARIAAIDDPSDTLYRIEPSGRTRPNDFPNATTGSPGQAVWRRLAVTLVAAGYDVLLYDRRGVGLSSGYSDTNTLQQGRDILAIVAALHTGAGLRALAADGTTVEGATAARLARGVDPAAALPVLLLGSSRGSMASGWAMTINFATDCAYDMPDPGCRPPRRDPSIRGAMLLSEFVSGVGYVSRNTTPEDEAKGLGRDRGLFIAGSEVESNIVFFPSSAILAGMDRWPAVFLAKGLWDYATALEGTVDAYRRVRGPRELMVVRGPHPFETWPASEQRRLSERVVAFADAVVGGRRDVPGGRRWHDLRSLVATTSDVWERSTRPTVGE